MQLIYIWILFYFYIIFCLKTWCLVSRWSRFALHELSSSFFAKHFYPLKWLRWKWPSLRNFFYFFIFNIFCILIEDSSNSIFKHLTFAYHFWMRLLRHLLCVCTFRLMCDSVPFIYRFSLLSKRSPLTAFINRFSSYHFYS